MHTCHGVFWRTPRTPAIPSYQFIVELYCDKMIRRKGAAYIQCAAFLLAMIIVDENEQPKAYRRSSSGLAVSFVLKKPRMSSVLKWCSWKNNPKNCAPFWWNVESTSGKHISTAPSPPIENDTREWTNDSSVLHLIKMKERCELLSVCCTLYDVLHTRISGDATKCESNRIKIK